jgi:hypothetical protein
MTDPAQPAPVSRDTRQPCEFCKSDDRREYHFEDCTRNAPVAEASEDTEPARCAPCGHRQLRHRTRVALSGSFDWCDECERPCTYVAEFVPAPASDDEITPGPSVDEWVRVESPFPEQKRVGYFRKSDERERYWMPLEVEAAIRAPLEAELEAAQTYESKWFEAVQQLAAVTAERDRLREGLATHRHTNECLEYAARTGAPFCIVSCGDSWRVLNWPAPATEEVQG